MFIQDNTLSTGTLGLITNNNSSSDSSFVPTITICEGTESNIKNRTTLGINTYSPNTNDYSLDVNGKTHIGHGEIHLRAKPQFIVSSMSFSKENNNFGMVVGKSLTNSDTSYNSFVTEDGGDNWTMKEVVGDGTINNNNDNVLTVHVSGTSNAYISVDRPNGTNDLILYSTNKGDTWTRIVSALTLRYRNIFGYFDTSHNIFASSLDNDYKLYYYTVANNGSAFATDISFSTNHFIEDITGINNTIYSIGGHLTDPSGVIGKYTFDVSNSTIVTYEKSFNGPTSFNRIYAYDINNTGYNLHDVHLLSSEYGIAMSSDAIVYSNDSYATWNPLPNSLMNASGMRTRLIDDLDTNSRLSMSLSSSLIISHVIDNASSDLLYNYFPSLFDFKERIMDISGSVFVEGTLICGGLQLTSTSSDTGGAEGSIGFDSVTVNTINSGQSIQF